MSSASPGIERFATVIPVSDLTAAVEVWTALLGTTPTFVDGTRWAQFDVAGARIALSGSDRMTDEVAIMCKVEDLPTALANAASAGLAAGPTERGPHEERAVVSGADVPIILYQPRTP